MQNDVKKSADLLESIARLVMLAIHLHCPNARSRDFNRRKEAETIRQGMKYL
uniref:Uncharacterized protein n=2 Tax=Pseudomonas TaxID=286 RepID=A0A7G8AC46_PSEAI|nr:Hypothetical protein [Pseudomonas putida]QNI15618.1 Hypothetical protein [Pseudomonas aeruginosa]QNI16567.1 Hypothetical protein [Pseudomonas aeruginosa]QNI17061.1 Hypothetical protein [Pseudomonas sp.]